MGQAGTTFDTFNGGLGQDVAAVLLHFPSYLFLVLDALERKALLNRFYIKNIAQAIIVAAAARINGS